MKYNHKPSSQAGKAKQPARKPSVGSKQPLKKDAQRRRSSSALTLKGSSQSSLNRALQTQKRSSRLADQVIDNANVADKQSAPKGKNVDLFQSRSTQGHFSGWSGCDRR